MGNPADDFICRRRLWMTNFFTAPNKTYRAIFIALFVLLTVNLLNAQTNGIRSVISSADPRYNEWQLKSLRQNTRESDRFNPTSWEKNVQDFRELQIINNELQKILFTDQKFDVRYARSLLRKINKIAVRLDKNLLLPSSTEPAEINEAGKKLSFHDSVKFLDENILRFKSSPAFRETRVLKWESAVQAKNDLQMIKFLSARLKNELAGKE